MHGNGIIPFDLPLTENADFTACLRKAKVKVTAWADSVRIMVQLWCNRLEKQVKYGVNLASYRDMQKPSKPLILSGFPYISRLLTVYIYHFQKGLSKRCNIKAFQALWCNNGAVNIGIAKISHPVFRQHRPGILSKHPDIRSW